MLNLEGRSYWQPTSLVYYRLVEQSCIWRNAVNACRPAYAGLSKLCVVCFGPVWVPDCPGLNPSGSISESIDTFMEGSGGGSQIPRFFQLFSMFFCVLKGSVLNPPEPPVKASMDLEMDPDGLRPGQSGTQTGSKQFKIQLRQPSVRGQLHSLKVNGH